MVLPEPDMPLTTIRRVAADVAWSSVMPPARSLSGTRCAVRGTSIRLRLLAAHRSPPTAHAFPSPWRLPAHLVRLTVEERLRRIDALGLEHVVAHRRLDQHRQVAAGRARTRGPRAARVQHLAVAVGAVDAL